MMLALLLVRYFMDSPPINHAKVGKIHLRKVVKQNAVRTERKGPGPC